MKAENKKAQAQVTLDPFAMPGYIGTKTTDDILKKKKTLTHISLFTGIGGFDLGFHATGFESRVMIEMSKDCCATLRANWFWSEMKNRKKYNEDGISFEPRWKNKEEMKKDISHYQDREPVIIQKDIREVTTKEILEAAKLDIGECSIISGGPPCQGFSTANTKRTVDDPRNFAFKSFVRIVREALPRMMILENVPGMVSSTKGKVIRDICKEFADCGYDITWNIIDCANYGVPQYRKRIIMIGKRVDLMWFPEIGNPQLHMGGQPGKITHPAWYIKKYKFELTEQENTHDRPREDARRDWARTEKEKQRKKNDSKKD